MFLLVFQAFFYFLTVRKVIFFIFIYYAQFAVSTLSLETTKGIPKNPFCSVDLRNMNVPITEVMKVHPGLPD